MNVDLSPLIGVEAFRFFLMIQGRNSRTNARRGVPGLQARFTLRTSLHNSNRLPKTSEQPALSPPDEIQTLF